MRLVEPKRTARPPDSAKIPKMVTLILAAAFVSFSAGCSPSTTLRLGLTSAFNDVEETLLTYQLTNLQFKMTPKQFVSAIKMNIPKDN
ncbi:hypothetical protein SAMN04487970_1003136 [Paenibacillus tianmuensis]|uniref:Uncharacterized protein n=1 Tax=Paenibacillus tianmuensis TaxID=624147 RepID=A0A1G4PNK9_9BACL|nr:hypothetical protein SAMN04487970_1003136 [Paenibacillus tianmuensis]